jgi:hypothetical protein
MVARQGRMKSYRNAGEPPDYSVNQELTTGAHGFPSMHAFFPNLNYHAVRARHYVFTTWPGADTKLARCILNRLFDTGVTFVN